MTVMIVDDNIGMRATIREAIQPYCDSIVECSDGSEALSMYQHYTPDWVLMDIRMKKLDGFAASKQILTKDPKAKIIILTQYNDRGFREKAEQIGVAGYALKDNLAVVQMIFGIQKESKN